MSSRITEAFFAEGAFIAWKKASSEKFEIAERDGILETKEGPQSYKAGYRILTGPQGEKYSMPEETFDKLKVDNGDGTATPIKIPKLAKLADHNGEVQTSWGETLQYRAEEDYIVRHGKGDYGVVKTDIFKQTYQTEEGGQTGDKESPLGNDPAPRIRRGERTRSETAATTQIDL